MIFNLSDYLILRFHIIGYSTFVTELISWKFDRSSSGEIILKLQCGIFNRTYLIDLSKRYAKSNLHDVFKLPQSWNTKSQKVIIDCWETSQNGIILKMGHFENAC